VTASTPSIRSLAPRSASTALIALAAGLALLYYGRAFLVTLCMAFITAFILEPFVGLLIAFACRGPWAVSWSARWPSAWSISRGWRLHAGLGRGGGVPQVRPTDQQHRRPGGGCHGFHGAEAEGPGGAQTAQRAAGASSGARQTAYQTAARRGVRLASTSRARRSARSPHPAESVPLAALLFGGWAMSVYEILLMASFIPFLVYFMLSWRDHLLLSFLQLFQGQGRIVASNSLNGIARIIRAFVVGNTLLACCWP